MYGTRQKAPTDTQRGRGGWEVVYGSSITLSKKLGIDHVGNDQCGHPEVNRSLRMFSTPKRHPGGTGERTVNDTK